MARDKKPLIIVSACLLGVKCRYKGDDNSVPWLTDLAAKGKLLPVCPEQLGGLSTPRPPAEIWDGTGLEVVSGQGKVITKAGADVTTFFLRGAKETLRLAELIGATEAILKDGSPSCGSNLIYDGSFMGSKRSGEGVTTALLRKNGLRVFSEQDSVSVIKGLMIDAIDNN